MILSKTLEKTFCPKPWTTLDIPPYGVTRICCYSTYGMTENGKPVSIYEKSISEIWHSNYFSDIRAAMLAGEKVRECESCYISEKHSGVSPRLNLLGEWNKGFLNPEGYTFLKLYNKHIIKPPWSPRQLLLALGNKCNLSCRMCGGNWSSSIQRDPIQSSWRKNDVPNQYFQEKHWSQNEDFLFKELFAYCDDLRFLYMIGGEPFIIKEFREILKYLVEHNRTDLLTISFSTNATIKIDDATVDLLKQFKNVVPIVSLDGVGKAYEYIRYPAKWSRVETNIQTMKKYFNEIRIHPTVQAYNCLNLVDIFKFCADNELALAGNILKNPDYLSVNVLPVNLRNRCVENLKEYLSRDCPDNQKKVIKQFVDRISGVKKNHNERKLFMFMQYTNALDISRNQLIHEFLPTLTSGLKDAGVKWPKVRLARVLYQSKSKIRQIVGRLEWCKPLIYYARKHFPGR